MVSQPKSHHKNAKGPNRMAAHHIRWDRGKGKLLEMWWVSLKEGLP